MYARMCVCVYECDGEKWTKKRKERKLTYRGNKNT